MEHKPTFTDYLNILFKWKRLIIINMLLVFIVVSGLTLLIDNRYKASSTVMLSSKNSVGGGALGGLISSAGSFLGGSLLGMGGDEADKMIGILGSRVVLEKVIKEFALVEYYEINKMKRDKAIKALREDLGFDMNENGMIEITMVHKDTLICAEIVNYTVSLLDSINKSISSTEATSYREFIEKRFSKNIRDIKNAENEFEKFQIKYGVYVIPEQIEFAIKFIGEIEAQLIQFEMKGSLVKFTQGEKSPAYFKIAEQIRLLKNKLHEIKTGSNTEDNSIVLFPFEKTPKIQKEYFQIYREITIQGKIQEFIMPIFEQAVMEEHKNIPTIIVLDKAVSPQLKYSPKRSLIVLGISFIVFFILILIVFRGEEANNRTMFRNPIEKIESMFYVKVIKIYGIKIG